MNAVLARIVRGSPLGGYVAVVLLAGCGLPRAAVPTLPPHQEFVAEQFVVHGKLPMPVHDRLVSQLSAQLAVLSRDLALPVCSETIHVYLFDDAGQFEECRRRRHPDSPPGRAFFPRRKTPLEVYALASDRLAEDLRHEVTHAYLYAVLRKQPRWLDEGLAEYYEVPGDRRGMNQAHVDLLLDGLAKGTWRPDLARLDAMDAGGSMPQLEYAESWAWVHLLLGTDPSRADLLREYLGDLQRGDDTRRLSDRLRAAASDPRQELIVHLERLRASR